MPSTTHWRLVPKLRPEHVENHEKFVAELAEVNRELSGISIVARILSPKKSNRRRDLLRKQDLLQRQIIASHFPVGADVGPPRIGIDKAATKWYRAYLAKDENAWPLPPDEMVEEMSGHPVWELCKPRIPFDLGLEWPTQPLPMPLIRGLTSETQAAMMRDLSGEEAVAVADRIRADLFAHLRRLHPELADAPEQKIVATLQDQARAGAPAAAAAPSEEVKEMVGALSAALWLEFWGKHGYAFTTGETVT